MCNKNSLGENIWAFVLVIGFIIVLDAFTSII